MDAPEKLQLIGWAKVAYSPHGVTVCDGVECPMLMAILRNLFQTKKQRGFNGLLAQALATKPPPLPAARVEYVLYRSGDGLFDIKDGVYIVGSLARQEAAEEHGGYWEASVHAVSFLSFVSFNEANQWLGNPPVRTYR